MARVAHCTLRAGVGVDDQQRRGYGTGGGSPAAPGGGCRLCHEELMYVERHAKATL
jgi:hypothetical protein